jgi:hypothetical protein
MMTHLPPVQAQEQQRAAPAGGSGGEGACQFVDQRPQAQLHQRMQQTADHSARGAGAMQLRALIGGRGAQSDAARVAQRAVAQRKIGAETNVIFGLSGKSAEAIAGAITAGYTTFDGADTYGDTINLLATAIDAAIADDGKTRDDFEIIYKVDATAPDALAAHITTVANKFGGYLDQVLIHKMTAGDQAALYAPILAQLKTDGVALAVGGGDVKGNMGDDKFAGKDSFEIDANDIFLGADAATLCEKLNATEKPVFLYNIVATVKAVLGLDDAPTQAQVAALISMARGKVPKSEPILSSSTTERTEANLAIHGTDETEVFTARGEIEAGIGAMQGGTPIAEMPPADKELVMQFLFSHDWAGQNLFPTVAEYAAPLAAALALFNDEQLNASYAFNDKTYTLRHLVEMLFDHTGNCHRVEASNALGAAMG